MAETLSFQNFEGCEDCLFPDYSTEQPLENLEAASAYALWHAAEAAGDEAGAKALEPTPKQRGIVFGGDLAQRRFSGAVGFCGRTIGKGQCPMWVYDSEKQKIVARVEN